MLKSFLQVLDRQGRLKGDLNWVQRSGLAFLMSKEIDDDITMENIRMENMALATNPQTSMAFINRILNSGTNDEMEEELADEGYRVEWHTPKDASEVEDVLRNLGLSVPSS